MAKLPPPKQGGNPEASAFMDWPQPPAGVHYGRILKIVDLYGVTRRKFQSEETEVKDITRWFVGVRTPNGDYVATTREMRLSGDPKANLFRTLKAILGRDPEPGFDYDTLVDAPVIVRVKTWTKQDDQGPREASVIEDFQTVMQGQDAYCPSRNDFGGWREAVQACAAAMLESSEAAPPPAAPGNAPAPAAYPPPRHPAPQAPPQAPAPAPAQAPLPAAMPNYPQQPAGPQQPAPVHAAAPPPVPGQHGGQPASPGDDDIPF